MSDKMNPIRFQKLLSMIFDEYKKQKSIFGIPEHYFFKNTTDTGQQLFGSFCSVPLGPAAGPHTQLAQNIVTAFLCGGRFIELKTVQILDSLELDKPCIDAENEGYNTEWSTELTVEQAFDEYLKAWIIIHLLDEFLGLSRNHNPGIIFNMSVGYDLKGIKSKKIDNYIESMKDASDHPLFGQYKKTAVEFLNSRNIRIPDQKKVFEIPGKISNIITLSTMHGCPPEEQESIMKYLIQEKKVHTFIKLNPTLNGYEYTREKLRDLKYNDIRLDPEKFSHDLQYTDALSLVKKLQSIADDNRKGFGIKLSNTLPVINTKGKLPGKEMYMSGKALFPLTYNLARKLKGIFGDAVPLSYSGGANIDTIDCLISAGFSPVTVATDILKPGGYTRFYSLAKKIEKIGSKRENSGKNKACKSENFLESLDFSLLRKEADLNSKKIGKPLPLFDCYIAPCKETCPIGQDVPEYISLVGKGQYRQALELILSKNPLPHITGYICDHQCMFKCMRNHYEGPVQIRELKKNSALKGFEEFLEKFEHHKPKHYKAKVFIIGAGPAGLASAAFFARDGFDVTVLDKNEFSGGVVRYILPDFRYPKEIIEKEVSFLKRIGVKFIHNPNFEIDLSKIKAQGFNFVILATGAPVSNDLGLEKGEAFSAMEFLALFNKKSLPHDFGHSIAVIGGGNSAMDSARAASKIPGVEKVMIIYRRDLAQMPADREEFENALKEGVEFYPLLNPVSFENGILRCQKMKLGEQDDTGRARPVPVTGEIKEIKTDRVISAVGEHPDFHFLEKMGIALSKKEHETNIKGVFATGDLFTGPSTVIRCVADAKSLKEEIISKYKDKLHQNNRDDENFGAQVYIDGYNKNTRSGDVFDSHAKIYKKGEVEYFLESGDVMNVEQEEIESSRCLRCNLQCGVCVEVCPNRANILIQVQSSRFMKKTQVVHLDSACNECGNCSTFCPYEGKPFRDKFTLFAGKAEFEASENPGFYLNGNNEVICRYEGKIMEFTPNNPGNGKNGNDIGRIIGILEVIKKDYSYLLDI